jgi:hypothetical protein
MKLLHRLRFVLLAVTGAILIAASVYTLRSDGTSAPSDEVRGHLGPTPGPSSEEYIQVKQAYLDAQAATDPQQTTAALVSMRAYADAPGVQDLVSGGTAVAVWVRFPSAEAELVIVETTIAGAVADAASAHRQALDAEVTELTEQAAAATGAQKTELERLASERKAAVTRSGADCLCVFAVSVEDATLEELKVLADRPAIRHVDVPDPLTDDLSGWELQPIVPAQAVTTSPSPAASV